VRSRTTAAFRRALDSLPPQVRAQAERSYELFRSNPKHPGLRFKPVHPSRPIYSVRIGIHYRALGVLEGDEIIWFWVGSHDQYERLINLP
jgi:hypothetical protein